jgi:hypothetical protein
VIAKALMPRVVLALAALWASVPASSRPAASPVSAPSLRSLEPTTVVAGSAAFVLEVNGSSFRRGAVVRLDGESLVTTFVSPSRLTARMPASRLMTAGTMQITVYQKGGGSPPLPFVIAEPDEARQEDDWAMLEPLRQGRLGGGR